MQHMYIHVHVYNVFKKLMNDNMTPAGSKYCTRNLESTLAYFVNLFLRN